MLQVCTRPDLAFVIGILGIYQSNPGQAHWIMVKKALRYVQGTKGLMLTYRKSDSLEIEGYSDADFAGTSMTEIPRPVMCSHSQGELYRGKAPNKASLHHRRCTLNLWHVMRPRSRLNG